MELWIKLLFAGFLFGCVVFADDDVCPATTPKLILPSVPESYHALAQLQSTFLKATINLEYAKLGDGYFSYEQGGAKSVVIFDERRKQLIRVAEKSHKKGEEACTVETLSDENGWDVGKENHKKISMTGADWYLRYATDDKNKQLAAVDLGKGIENGVEVQMYGICLTGANVYLKVNMTTNKNWTPLHGGKESVPTSVWSKASVNGEVTEDFVTFFEFEKSYAPEGIFNIPDDVVCFGLNNLNGRTIPKLPNKFSYQSEIITKSADGLTDFIVYQNHVFDSEMNYTRFDYRPIVKGQIIDTQRSHPEGVLTEVHDFWSGLSYTFDKTTGKCKFGPIPTTVDDVKVINGNKVIINNPMAYLGLSDYTYTFYKEERRRGIDALQFRAYDKKTFFVHEYWFSSAKNIIQEAHTFNHMQPMTHIQYSIMDPDLNRTVTNFFNFDIDRPSIHLYDISGCFSAKEKRRFLFQMKGTLDILNIANYEDLENFVLLAIIQNCLITALRVSHIEMSSVGTNTAIMFTLLEKKNVEGDGNIKDNELSTDQAINMLKAQLDAGKVYIELPSNVTQVAQAVPNSLVELTELVNRKPEIIYIELPCNITPITQTVPTSPVEVSTVNTSQHVELSTVNTSQLVELSTVNTSQLVELSTVNTSQLPEIVNGKPEYSGYSAGSMAGLAIPMIILGLLLGGGAAHFYLLKQK